ncbi:late embryogenesis abundant protein 47-like [Bidens hawaiensis]|uniref:late embryogenesis abundant protein 47-like n=1 Tax=Bidens hawaiensis TaxID=980011 RepID=UPI004049877A
MSQLQPMKPQLGEETQDSHVNVAAHVQENKDLNVQVHKDLNEESQSYDVIVNKWVKNVKGGRKNSELAAASSGEQILTQGHITIGEALEATALTAGSRPVDYSDAAAIQAAEVRATGRTNIVPGGVAAAAQSAATRNARLTRDDEKTKLSEILAEATSKLPADKPVTRRDAEGVIGAELRNDPNLTTRPGGVAASLAAAARINQINNVNQNSPRKE